jgi:cytochrome c biogenesis protein CcdA
VIGLLLAALGLGLAGFDPAGALFAAGALAAGARERHVVAFGLVTCLGTAAFGTALSLTVGPRITDLDWGWFFSSPGALIEAVLGLVLVAWGLARAWRPTTRAPKPRSPRGTGPLALLALAVLFALMAILDPTFDALVVIAGRGEHFWSVAVAHSVWIAVSQAPLVLLLAAMASGKHRRFVARFQSWWEKIRPAVGRIVTAAALLVGAFFLLDAGWFFATGEFLVPVGSLGGTPDPIHPTS